MEDAHARTRLLLGPAALEHLRAARVAVFGLGGVGGYAVEALARSGVGALDLIDDDRIGPSNLNRQLLATHSTLGQYKADAAAARVRDIDPACQVTVHRLFFGPQTQGELDLAAYSYVVDAVDTVSAKLALVLAARAAGVPVISCMGAGNKLDAGALRVADIYDTSVCPLARVMRKELKKRGVPALKVVYSTEAPRPGGVPDAQPDPDAPPRPGAPKRQVPGSWAVVPAVAGLLLAGEVIRDLAGAR